MIVYDVTDKDTLYRLTNWIAELRRICGDIPIVIGKISLINLIRKFYNISLKGYPIYVVIDSTKSPWIFHIFGSLKKTLKGCRF